MWDIVTATRENVFSVERWMGSSEDIDWSFEQLQKALVNPKYVLRLAVSSEVGEKQVISAGVGFLLAHFVGEECTLMMVGVDVPSRCKGVGRQLTQDLLLQAKNRGASYIFLEVRESNAPAIALYNSFGFERCGERAGYYPAQTADKPKEAALIMRLGL